MGKKFPTESVTGGDWSVKLIFGGFGWFFFSQTIFEHIFETNIEMRDFKKMKHKHSSKHQEHA